MPAVAPGERTGRLLISPPTLPVGAASAGAVPSPCGIDVEVVLGFGRQLPGYFDLVSVKLLTNDKIVDVDETEVVTGF